MGEGIDMCVAELDVEEGVGVGVEIDEMVNFGKVVSAQEIKQELEGNV